jgi:adenosine deaminase
MPKAELHVHLEGAIQPTTLLTLAQRHRIKLPATTVEGLRAWYTFKSFSRFIKVYLTISSCIRTTDDIELIAREFLAGQAAQNIRYSEVTYTAYTHYYFKKIPFRDQLAALNRARAWAEAEHGITMGLIIDIPRVISAKAGLLVADWAISGMGEGVVALGLGGPEVGNPPERYRAAFERARSAGLPRVPHAGETVGPKSIWGALRTLHADRIGHGVRCLEDPTLVAELRARQIPLDVCLTSNVCLHVVPTLPRHPLPRLLAEGLYVTINSDDPPLFNTTLTDEYLALTRTFQLGVDDLARLALNAVRASLLPEATRAKLESEFRAEFVRCRSLHLSGERDGQLAE